MFVFNVPPDLHQAADVLDLLLPKTLHTVLLLGASLASVHTLVA